MLKIILFFFYLLSYYIVFGENWEEELKVFVDVIEWFNMLFDGFFFYFKVENGVSRYKMFVDRMKY